MQQNTFHQKTHPNPMDPIDINLLRIDRLWRHIFSIFGQKIAASRSKNEKKQQCNARFALFALLHTFSTVMIAGKLIFDISQGNNYFSKMIVYSSVIFSCAESTLFLVTFRRKENEFSALLKRILTPLEENFGKEAWKWVLVFVFFNFLAVLIAISVDINVILEENEGNRTICLDNASLKEEFDNLSPVFLFSALLWYLTSYLYVGVAKVFVIHVCHVISLRFAQLKRKNEENPRFFTEFRVEKFHKEFYRVVGDVNYVSRAFSPILIVWIVVDVAYLCCVLRGIKIDYCWTGALIVYCVREFGLLVFMFVYAGKVHSQGVEAALSIADLVLRRRKTSRPSFPIDEENWKNQVLFGQKLSFISVGVSVSGLFVIKSGSILTILGIMLSYIVVLFQTNL